MSRTCPRGDPYLSRREVEVLIRWQVVLGTPALCHLCFHWHVAPPPVIAPVGDFAPLVEKLGY